jgi:hypothetical protein
MSLNFLMVKIFNINNHEARFLGIAVNVLGDSSCSLTSYGMPPASLRQSMCTNEKMKQSCWVRLRSPNGVG